jgi:acyl-CoA synthetase (AMP-forming)/AMP-acid ligase II|tara:strand:- start:5215 stop:6378 length:1164 start_codon:yes stop_codon:yes gene_type:complete
MPKTIAITPSWYWPDYIDRVAGIPPFAVNELCIDRHARLHPDDTAIIAASERVSYAELQQRVNAAAHLLRERAGDPARVVMNGELSLPAVYLLLGCLAGGLQLRIAGADDDIEGAAREFGADLTIRDCAAFDPGESGVAVQAVQAGVDFAGPAITIAGRRGLASHSHRSLLATAISCATFLHPLTGRPWLATLPLNRWEGLASVLLPLFAGVPLVIGSASAEHLVQTIQEQQPGYAVLDLSTATLATREARRAVRKARDILDSMLLCTEGAFDPGDRQRVGKSFRCNTLTVFGLAETGAVFASHPQWYLDESVGIPITNAHVVPSDPRNGSPIQTLWELVESAEVTVKGPMLMCAGDDDAAHFTDGRFRTGVIASSDANGMIYLLPD